MAPYSAIVVRTCRQAQPDATIVNLTPLNTDADYGRSPDDYHPDNLGHFAMAEAICTAMERQKLLGWHACERTGARGVLAAILSTRSPR